MERGNLRGALATWWRNIGADDALNVGRLSGHIQAVYIADDLSHLQLPQNLALSMAGANSRTGLTAGSNPVIELSVPMTLQGVWCHFLNVTPLGSASAGTVYRRLTATDIDADALVATNQEMGTLTPLATVTTGTTLTGGVPVDAPADVGIMNALPTPVFVPGGSILNASSLSASTTMIEAMAIWVEVPKMLSQL